MQKFVISRITVAMATLKNFNFFHVFERHKFFKATRAPRVLNAGPLAWYYRVQQEILILAAFDLFPISLQNFRLAALKLRP